MKLAPGPVKSSQADPYHLGELLRRAGRRVNRPVPRHAGSRPQRPHASQQFGPPLRRHAPHHAAESVVSRIRKTHET